MPHTTNSNPKRNTAASAEHFGQCSTGKTFRPKLGVGGSCNHTQTQFRYDGLNRVTEITDARQGLTRFAYDRNGNLLTVTDAKNKTTMYTYDAMDRVKTRTDSLGRSESYQYDSAGNLKTFLDREN